MRDAGLSLKAVLENPAVLDESFELQINVPKFMPAPIGLEIHTNLKRSAGEQAVDRMCAERKRECSIRRIRNKHKANMTSQSTSNESTICGAETVDGGSCNRRTADRGPCYLHDESEVPNTHGAPEGNQNAIGNSGGGAPAGNTNALTHGSYASRETLWSEMSAADREWFEELQKAISHRLDSDHESIGEDIAWLLYQASLADVDLAERGLDVGKQRMNPSLPRSRRLSSRAVELLSKHALLE